MTTTNRLIIIAGYAGVGKTTVGHMLAQQFPVVFLDKDMLSDGFVQALLEAHGHSPHDRESDFYTYNVRPLEYRHMESVALENIGGGNNVVMVAPYIREMNSIDWYNKMVERADMAGAQCEMVWVHCDVDTMHQYLSTRNNPRDSWKLDHWEQYSPTVSLQPELPFKHHVIDNSQPAVEGSLQAQIEVLISSMQ